MGESPPNPLGGDSDAGTWQKTEAACKTCSNSDENIGRENFQQWWLCMLHSGCQLNAAVVIRAKVKKCGQTFTIYSNTEGHL